MEERVQTAKIEKEEIAQVKIIVRVMLMIDLVVQKKNNSNKSNNGEGSRDNSDSNGENSRYKRQRVHSNDSIEKKTREHCE